MYCFVVVIDFFVLVLWELSGFCFFQMHDPHSYELTYSRIKIEGTQTQIPKKKIGSLYAVLRTCLAHAYSTGSTVLFTITLLILIGTVLILVHLYQGLVLYVVQIQLGTLLMCCATTYIFGETRVKPG